MFLAICLEDTANKNNYQVVVKPVDFEITCTSDSKTVEVSKFNGFIERMVAIPDGVNPSKITTGIVLNHDGTFSHVPTSIMIINCKYYAKINSLTNSTYSIVWNSKTFKDIEKPLPYDLISKIVKFRVAENIKKAEGNGKKRNDLLILCIVQKSVFFNKFFFS